MAAVYVSIPLFVVMILVAVMPVLYGTLKHRQWEETELASSANQVSVGNRATLTPMPVTAASAPGPHKLGSRDEAIAALARLEQLRDYFETELERLHLHGRSATNMPAEGADF
jgi:hypothetical protein